MHTIVNTIERRVIVHWDGYAQAGVGIQELNKWNPPGKEIIIDSEDVLPLLHALRTIQGELERGQYVPLRWKTDDEPEDDIPF